MEIRVSIIEDHADTRNMLALLIGEAPNFDCVGSFENGEDALRELPQLATDVVLVDIHLPGISGIDCVRELKQIMPNTEFIMCTSIEDSDSVFNALKAGASGYLSKTTSPSKILDALQDAYNGGSPMSSSIARKVVGYFQKKESTTADFEKLTAREKEILDYLSKGYRYKEIAGLLFLSIETVRKHIHNIYQKLQVSSRTDALNKVYRHNQS